MKALTLTQPWATLVAIGAKRIETRSWRTNYRGRLAIHAANTPDRTGVVVTRYFWPALKRAGLNPLELPLGVVVATCTLVECYEIPDERRLFRRADLDYFNIGAWLPPDDPERSFGDYTPGRYAWLLTNIQALPQPVPARGALGLWDWNEQDLGVGENRTAP